MLVAILNSYVLPANRIMFQDHLFIKINKNMQVFKTLFAMAFNFSLFDTLTECSRYR